MEKQATVFYYLSQKGRKQSLLAGGDGKQEQKITCPITSELLEFANVDSYGEVSYWFGKNIVTAKDIQIRSYGPYSSTAPYFINDTTHVFFDEPQTIESLLAWETNRLKAIEDKKVELLPELEKQIAEWQVEREKYLKEQKEQEEKMAKNEEQKKAAREKLHAEKLAWIVEHGSNYLQRATKLGYDCQRKYVEERCAAELGENFSVDFDDNYSWRERVCPSDSALEIVEKLIANGYSAEVVWVTSHEDEHEAIVIHRYLGKYDAVCDL